MNCLASQRVLLIGANGQLGQQLHVDLLAIGRVHGFARIQAEMSSPESLRQKLNETAEQFLPTIIVNAAAYTAVDKAETETAQATTVNAESAKVLAEFAQSIEACLVHYSTDYVFDGSGSHAWGETDMPAPMSVYGQTKYLGEQAIRKNCKKHLILRTSWVVGVHGSNFLKTILRLAADRETLRVVADQIGVPTSTQLLADVTVGMLRAMQFANDDDARWGIYHVAAAGETSWHGYAQYVVTGALQRGLRLKASPEKVLPITTEEYPLPAPRPLNSRLNTIKLQKTFGFHLPTWQQGVDQILDELLKEKNT